MTTQSNIDLTTCVPGQKVRFRDGKIGIYNGLIDHNETYTHAVDGYSYTGDGCFWDDDRISNKDVVLIFPLKEPIQSQTITDQIDVTNPDHVSIIPHKHGVTISIKKGLTTISWRHCNH